MVKGNLILISNDIEHSMSRILPSDQQLLPVSFKRKLEYKGSFIEEWIDVEKVKSYFKWFKKHNPLYKDVELSEDLIKQFEDDSLAGAKEFENIATNLINSKEDDIVHPDMEEVDDELYCSDDEDIMKNPTRKAAEMDQTSMFCNKYETDTNLPTVANRMADMIIDYESSNNIDALIEDDFEQEYTDVEFDPDEITPKQKKF